MRTTYHDNNRATVRQHEASQNHRGFWSRLINHLSGRNNGLGVSVRVPFGTIRWTPGAGSMGGRWSSGGLCSAC